MTDRTLIKDAIVLTQDPTLGELPRADILVEDDRIAAVGPNLQAADAKVIDAAGDIVIPGFIDTHRHTWETSIRTSAPDYTLGAYFGAILDKFAPNYRPDDVLAANRWGAIECANAGITTLVDWSHIMNSPDHADAAVEGLQDAGIRSVFAFGFPNTSIQAWWFGPDWAGTVERIDGDEAHRIRKVLSDDQGLITMALATRGTNFCKEDVVRYEWELAQASWASTSPSTSRWTASATRRCSFAGSRSWACSSRTRRTSTRRICSTTSGRWSRTRAATSRSRRRSRCRWATAGRPRRRPRTWASPSGLSSDVATTASSDQFTQMHAIFASERGRRHQAAWDADCDAPTDTRT